MSNHSHGTDRTPRVVFEDHLRISTEGSVEEDLARNYAPDLVVLTGRGVYRGHDGLRQLAALLRRELPHCTYDYHTRLVEGDVAFLEWTARADGAPVDDGADSYVIRNGRIVVQTHGRPPVAIHYTVTPVRDER